jgi:exodeoxyribonuclease VII small subunit
MPAPRAKSSSKQSFEELYQQLEEKVSLLEAGGLSLDDSLAAYEDAVTFAQRCQQLLDRAELRITRLRESMNSGGAKGEDDAAFEPDEEELEDEDEEDGA